jgi:hypothetical protein
MTPHEERRGGDATVRSERCGGSAVRPIELPAARAADPLRSSEVLMHER